MDIKEIRNKAQKLLLWVGRMVNPMPEVGGLDISDTALRYTRRIQGKILYTSLRLPPGIIEAGVVKDEANFVLALKKIHAQIVGEKEKTDLYVVISLPSEIVYSQVFSIPLLKGDEIENAVRLNLEMISPLKRGEAYSSAEQIGTRQDGGFQFEFLGAFAEAEKVDRIERHLFEAGFVVVAAEFPALSLARVVKEEAQGVDFTKPFVVVNVATTGINFLIIRNNQLHFQYYIPWAQVHLENHHITAAALRELIQHNLQQVMNFSMSRWSEKIENGILIAPGIQEEVKKIIAENFHLNLWDVSLKDAQVLSPEYLIAWGAALRGELARSEDEFISLLRVGIKEEFFLSQLMNFVNFWRTLVISVVGALLIVLGAGDAFIATVQKTIESENLHIAISPDAQNLQKLEGEAKEFNQMVSHVASVRAGQYAWSGFFSRINALASQKNIILTRVYFQSFSVPIIVNGIGASQDVVVAFKNLLQGEKNIQEVDLPLTSLVTTPSGVSFTLRFKLIAGTSP